MLIRMNIKKASKQTYILLVLVFFLSFLIGILRLNCYVLGDEVKAEVVKTEFNQGVERITVKLGNKTRVVKGYYSDKQYLAGSHYPVHKFGPVLTTKIDVSTSFILMLIGFSGIVVCLYKLTLLHILKEEKEKE